MPDKDQPQGIVRFPQGRVRVNGKPLPFQQFEVIQNYHHESDAYDIQAPLFDPLAPFDWKFWARETDIEIQIDIGFAETATGEVQKWTTMITGPVDGISLAPVAFGPHSNLATRARTEIGRGGSLPNETGPAHPTGALLQIRGRDYSGQLIDSEVSAQDISGALTSREIYENVLKNIPGIKIELDEGSDDSVGDPVQNQQGRQHLHRSAWDVITAVADHDGMRAIMKGRTLKIAPPQSNPGGNQTKHFELYYTPVLVASAQQEFRPATSNCITLRMARGLNVGRGTDHFVQGYDSQTGRRPSRAVARSRSSGRSSRSEAGQVGSPLTYNQNVPGMTQQQVEKHAKNHANNVSKFERDIEFQIPGDTALTVETPIRLSGTGTEFDQEYEVHQLTHFFDLLHGYRIEGRARNRSQDVKITVEPITQGSDPKAATKLPTVPNY